MEAAGFTLAAGLRAAFSTQQATYQSMGQQGLCSPAGITGQQQGSVTAKPRLPPGLPVGPNSSVAR